MNLQTYKETLQQKTPPADLSGPLLALWHAGKGDWHTSHEVTQSDNSPEMCWVHAYLHRDEGDLSNANHWYRRAGRSMPQSSLEAEWEDIATTLLGA